MNYREYQEKEIQLRYLVEKIKGRCCKSDKENYLREARSLAKELDLDLGNYNSPNFGNKIL